MEEKKIKNTKVIDLRIIINTIWSNRRFFYKVLSIVFVFSCIYIFSLPRYYNSDTKLAPEMENLGGGGTLSSLAASFGFDLGEMQTTDAITPLLYPDLMEDNGFVSSLMGIKVTSQDGTIKTTYHDYLQKHQKSAWWTFPISWMKSLIPKKQQTGGSLSEYDPYNISLKEDGILNIARNNINISTDKKTGVISIAVQAQDPLICKTLADSIKDKLQIFITNYRTNKARTDYNYYKKLADDAKQDYENARRQYGMTMDANTRVTLRSVELKMEEMENDMQLKFNTYTTINTQLQAANAKVQERTPAFTVIKGAAVPTRPAGPKRMIFVAAMMILATLASAVIVCRKYLMSFL